MEGKSTKTKRKLVDEAFLRMFGYEWGTHFGLDRRLVSSGDNELVQIFGLSRAARIIGVRGTAKRLKVGTEPCTKMLEYQNLLLPTGLEASSNAVSAGKQVQTKSKSQIDDVLEKLAGPSKTSTVKKTSDDWQAFKDTDKQLQDELEKQAQGKDAYLVKKDFLSRVDNRKFELEKEGRERERAKRNVHN